MYFETELRDDVSFFLGSGAITVDETIVAMSRWFPEHPTRLVVWDVRAMSFSSFNAAEFDRIPNYAAEFAAARGPDPRTAILIPENITSATLSDAYQERFKIVSTISLKIFHDSDEAMTWLKS